MTRAPRERRQREPGLRPAGASRTQRSAGSAAYYFCDFWARNLASLSLRFFIRQWAPGGPASRDTRAQRPRVAAARKRQSQPEPQETPRDQTRPCDSWTSFPDGPFAQTRAHEGLSGHERRRLDSSAASAGPRWGGGSCPSGLSGSHRRSPSRSSLVRSGTGDSRPSRVQGRWPERPRERASCLICEPRTPSPGKGQLRAEPHLHGPAVLGGALSSLRS